LENGARFVIRCLDEMQGGEVFVPKIPSMKLVDLAKAIAPQAEMDVVGVRPGEKLHEVLIHEDEARSAMDREGMYVVIPSVTLWQRDLEYPGIPLPEGFRYASDTNPEWLSVDQIRQMVAPYDEFNLQTT
jgi:UDP-N-acetylglucosamine 4,6-dehydratase